MRPAASLVLSCIAAAAAAGAARAEPDAEYEIFPREELFAPLVADVRWPRFAAEHQWRLGTDQFDRVVQFAFGESFAFVRSPERRWGRFELGLQAGVDALFDTSSGSFDLANEDYFIALTGSVETHGVTFLMRLAHTSSHLGDEYFEANGGPRESVSFEVLDLLASCHPTDSIRVYGGLGVILNGTPNFDPITTQLGVEWTSPVRFSNGLLTPITGVDLQFKQEGEFRPEVAVLLGIRLAAEDKPDRHIDLYTRYYHGRSPDGQFFRENVDSIGIGLRLGL